MNLIIWLVVGGLIGSTAGIVIETDGQQGIALTAIVGIVGSMLGGWLMSPLPGSGTANQNNFSISGLLVSSVVRLAIVDFFRRGKVR